MSISFYIAQLLFSATVLLLVPLGLQLLFLLGWKNSAALRHRFWSLTLIGLLLLPLLTPFLPHWTFGIIKKPRPFESVAQIESPAEVASFEPAEMPSIAEPVLPASVSLIPEDNGIAQKNQTVLASNVPTVFETADPTDELRTADQNVPETAGIFSVVPTVAAKPVAGLNLGKFLPNIFLAIWGIGTVGLLLRFVLSIRVARKLLDPMLPLTDERIVALAEEISRRLKIRKTPRLLQSEVGSVPFTLGLRQPCVVLPAVAVRDWSSRELRTVLTHELGHVARGDVAWQLLSRIVASLYWVHPLLWLAVWRIRVERELACDDLVLLEGERPTDYASILLELAASFKREHRHVLGCAVAIVQKTSARKNILRQRITSILNPRTHRTPLGRFGTAMLLLFASVSLLGAAMLSPLEQPEPKPSESQASTGQVKPESDATPKVDVAVASKNKDAPAVGTTHLFRDTIDNHFLWRTFKRGWKCVSASVLDENGAPFAEGARLNVRQSGDEKIFIPDEQGDVVFWVINDDSSTIITALAPDHARQALWLDYPLVSSEKLVFKLQPGRSFRGKVVNENNEPVANAKVRLDSGAMIDDMRRKTWDETKEVRLTDSEGMFCYDTLPSDSEFQFLRICVDHPDYEENCVVYKSVASFPNETVELKLKRGLPFRGVVLGVNPERPIEGASVSIWGRNTEVKTDSQGRFELQSVRSGSTSFSITTRNSSPENRKLVRLEENIQVGEVRKPYLFRLKPGKSVRIHIIDENGQPIPNAWVWSDEWKKGNFFDEDVPPEQADENGEYLGPATTRVSHYAISGPGYCATTVFLKPREAAYTVALSPQSEVSGKVVDALTGEPVRDFWLLPEPKGRHFVPSWAENEPTHWNDGTGNYTMVFSNKENFQYYRLRINAKDYLPAESPEIQPRREKIVHSFELQRNAWGAAEDPEKPTVRVRFLDENDRPIAGAQGQINRNDKVPNNKTPLEYVSLRKRWQYAPEWKSVVQEFRTDEKGEAILELPPRENFAGFRFSLIAPGYTPYCGIWDDQVLPPELTIKLPSTRRIGGIVRDPQGKPLEGIKVELTVPYEDITLAPGNTLAVSFVNLLTDSEGRWSIEDIPVNELKPRRLFLSHPGYKTTPVKLDLHELLPGANGQCDHVFTVEPR